ncbi:MAG: DUF349 domain-containing protein [Bacteroidota bacterium]
MIEEHPYGLIKGDKIIRKAFLEYPEKEIGVVKDSEEASIKYFEDRFDLARKKVDDVVQKIESTENKGSYLMKILHLKETLPNFDALGDYGALFDTLIKYETLLKNLIDKNRQRNLEIKKGLLEEVKPFLKSIDWKEDTEKVLEIKSRWVKTGAVPSEESEIEEEFKALIDDFFNRKASFYEDKRRMYESRKERYEKIINELTDLSKSPILFKKGRTIGDLKQQWRNLEKIPKSIYEDLRARYSEILKTTESNYREQKNKAQSEESEDHNENIQKREDILKAIKELESNSTEKDKKGALKQLLTDWKQSGPVPKKKYEEMNSDFFSAYDRVNEKQFIEKLARSKNRSFDQKTVGEQLKMKIGVINELIYRDKQELETAEENAQKFNSQSSGFIDLIQSKLVKSKKQLKVKQDILAEYKKFLTDRT